MGNVPPPAPLTTPAQRGEYTAHSVNTTIKYAQGRDALDDYPRSTERQSARTGRQESKLQTKGRHPQFSSVKPCQAVPVISFITLQHDSNPEILISRQVDYGSTLRVRDVDLNDVLTFTFSDLGMCELRVQSTLKKDKSEPLRLPVIRDGEALHLLCYVESMIDQVDYIQPPLRLDTPSLPRPRKPAAVTWYREAETPVLCVILALAWYYQSFPLCVLFAYMVRLTRQHKQELWEAGTRATSIESEASKKQAQVANEPSRFLLRLFLEGVHGQQKDGTHSCPLEEPNLRRRATVTKVVRTVVVASLSLGVDDDQPEASENALVQVEEDVVLTTVDENGHSQVIEMSRPPTSIRRRTTSVVPRLEEEPKVPMPLSTSQTEGKEEYDILKDSQHRSRSMPRRYLIVSGGSEEEAQRRWHSTLQWRSDHSVDRILQRPHLRYKLIKRYFPHFVAGRCKRDYPVYYEMTGKIAVSELKQAGVTVDDLVQHVVWVNEYIYTRLVPDPDGQIVTVIDIMGVSLRSLMGDSLECIGKLMAVIQAHYPARPIAILIVNTPLGVSYMWNLLRSLADDYTRKAIRFVSSSQVFHVLQELINEDQIPVEYGGKLRFAKVEDEHSCRFSSPDEVAMLEDAERVIAAADSRKADSSISAEASHVEHLPSDAAALQLQLPAA